MEKTINSISELDLRYSKFRLGDIYIWINKGTKKIEFGITGTGKHYSFSYVGMVKSDIKVRIASHFLLGYNKYSYV